MGNTRQNVGHVYPGGTLHTKRSHFGPSLANEIYATSPSWRPSQSATADRLDLVSGGGGGGSGQGGRGGWIPVELSRSLRSQLSHASGSGPQAAAVARPLRSSMWEDADSRWQSSAKGEDGAAAAARRPRSSSNFFFQI